MSKKNIFIIGLDDFNLELLQHLPSAKECQFYPALKMEDIRGVEQFDIDLLLEKARRQIDRFECKVDGICTYWDFPATTLLPILCKEYEVPGPSLESILICEHKYWSRLEQKKEIPEHIPRFEVFDPFEEDPFAQISLLPPYWIKPIKSFKSFLAYKVNDMKELDSVLPTIRENVSYIVDPFRALMRKYGKRPEFAAMKETFIAEESLSGAMCTLEGYVYEGKIVVYSVIDSVREGDRPSFSRYEYPSSLPLEVQHRMIDVARRAISEIGLTRSCFNIEFFYNQLSDEVYLLEINPRPSQAHADMIEKVHGLSHLEMMLSLAMGKRPRTLHYEGPYNVSAQFILRVFRDGFVKKNPSEEAIDRIAKLQPDTKIKVLTAAGHRLSELKCQDSYSYEIANIFIGGRDRRDLHEKYNHVCEELDFEIEFDEDKALQNISHLS